MKQWNYNTKHMFCQQPRYNMYTYTKMLYTIYSIFGKLKQKRDKKQNSYVKKENIRF